MTTALYRRYRPDTFQDVIGQDHVTAPLMAALRADRVTHAYLFSGPRGCGKTTSARILARCLNCEQGPTDTPCGQCASCKDLATGGGGSLDVVEIDAASHNGVDDARDLRERAAFAPARDRYKIFILDEAHMVTAQGFNALLKLVEEPPPHVKFIFATTEPEKVIGTIRSRTHHYPFRLVPPEILEGYLGKLCDAEGVQVGAGVFPLVVRAGGGSVRDTLSVMDQLIGGAVDGVVDYQRAVALLGFTDATLLDHCVDALAAADGAAMFRVVDRVVESGHDPRRFVEDLLQRLRDLLVIALAGQEAGPALGSVPQDQLARMEVQARTLGPLALSRSADMTAHALTRMVGATSPRLQLELLVARLIIAVSGQHDAVSTGVGGASVPTTPPVAQHMPGSGGQAVPANSGAPAGSSAGGPTGAAAAREALARAGVSASSSADASSSAGANRSSGVAQPVQAVVPSAASAPAAQSASSTPAQTASPVTPAPAEPAQAEPSAQSSPQSAPVKQSESVAAPAAKPAGIPTSWDDSDPAPTTGAISAPASNASGADAEMIRDRWQEVLGAVQRSHRATWALVGPNSQPGTIEAGVFTLLFSAPGLVGAFERSNHSEVMSEAITQALGLNLSVRATVAGAAAPAPAAPATPTAASPNPPAANPGVNEPPFEQTAPEVAEPMATVHRLHPLPPVPDSAKRSAAESKIEPVDDAPLAPVSSPTPAAAPTPKPAGEPAASNPTASTPGLGTVSWDGPAPSLPASGPAHTSPVSSASAPAQSAPATLASGSSTPARPAVNPAGQSASDHSSPADASRTSEWTPGTDAATESRMSAAIAAARAAAASDYTPPTAPVSPTDEDPFEEEIPDRNDPDAEESGAIGIDVVKRVLGATVLEEVTVTESGR